MHATEHSIVTQADEQRLRQMIGSIGESLPMIGDPFHIYLRRLANQLSASALIPASDVGPTIVTMNSTIRVHELDTGKRRTIKLVYPADANPSGDHVSVLSPLGASLLGAAEGDTVEWIAWRGPRRTRIDKVVFQPEAAGKFEL
jgi:regulator of nucleoside diphosphate kinase